MGWSQILIKDHSNTDCPVLLRSQTLCLVVLKYHTKREGSDTISVQPLLESFQGWVDPLPQLSLTELLPQHNNCKRSMHLWFIEA